MLKVWRNCAIKVLIKLLGYIHEVGTVLSEERRKTWQWCQTDIGKKRREEYEEKRIMWVKACKNNEANIENETKEKE